MIGEANEVPDMAAVFFFRPAFTTRASDRGMHIRLIFRTIRKLISAKAGLLTINLVDTDPAWKPQGVNKESQFGLV